MNPHPVLYQIETFRSKIFKTEKDFGHQGRQQKGWEPFHNLVINFSLVQ